MTNVERILTWAFNRKLGMKQALVVAIIAKYRFAATIIIAKDMGQSPRTIAPLIASLRERGFVIQHSEKMDAGKRSREGPRMRVQWKLDLSVQDQLMALERRAPTLPGTGLLKIRKPIKRPASRKRREKKVIRRTEINPWLNR